MKHFLFEFITGGGLIGQTLPDSLVREARTMVQTLIKELIACGHYKITITRDSRVQLFDHDVTQHAINTPFKKILPVKPVREPFNLLSIDDSTVLIGGLKV